MLPDPWLDDHTVSVGLRPTAFPDRKQLLELILSAVPSASTNGIVVVGEQGSGKSHLLLAIKAGLPDSMDVRTFAGKPELEATRFGALDAGEDPSGEHTALPGLHVLRSLTQTLGPADYLYTPPLRRRSKKHSSLGRAPLVLLVDDIHYVDPASLAVLLQLIPGFGATLVATADSRHPLPQDLYQLWEDGFLEQFFLPPFTFSEANALCEEVLGGQVQHRASSLLAVMSGFNVGILCLAVDDAREAGLLLLRDGYWTLDASAHCEWPRVVERVRAENANRTEEERRALELVALGEPLALETVERTFGQRAVERLLSAHHISLLPGRPPMVRTSSWLRGEGTRLSVPRSRSTALRLAIEGPVLSRESAPAMLRWMMWSLDAGMSLSDELLLSVAPAADLPSTAELALRAADAVRDPGHQQEAQLLRTRALIAEGQLTEAAPGLRELASSGSQADVREEAAHRLMALSLLGAATVPERLTDAGVAVGPDDPAQTVMDSIEEAGRLLLAGAAPEAMAKSAGAMAAIEQDPALEIFRPGVLLRHVVCLRHNLAWEAVDELLTCPGSYAMPAHMAVCLEVARGYAQLSQGLPRAARLTLRPAVAELHDAGLPPVLGFATALLGYCEALCGNPELAAARLSQCQAVMPEMFPARGHGLLGELGALFAAAAHDTVSGEISDGGGRVFAFAEEFHGRSPFLEAEALSFLTLNASSTAVDDLVLQRRLASLAGSVQGPSGAALRTFALALLDHDPKTLESAGRSLSADRQFAHAAVCYARAANGYEARTRSAASRRASVMMERLRRAFESDAVPPLGWLPGTAGR